MAALSSAQANMVTKTTQFWIIQDICNILPLARQFAFKRVNEVSVYREQENLWCKPVKVMIVCRKEVPVNDEIKAVTYGLSQFIPFHTPPHD